MQPNNHDDNLPTKPTPRRARLAALRGQMTAWLERRYQSLNRASGGLLPYLARAWADFSTRDTRFAASLAYYAIFSIFPLVLLTVILASGLVGPTLAQEQILEIIGSFFPADTLDLIEENIRLALSQRQSFGIVALIGLGWSGLSLFSNLTFALDAIFHPTERRSLWGQRLLALGMALILALMLFMSLLTSFALQLIGFLTLNQPNPVLIISTRALPLGLNVGIFALMFRFIPRVDTRWDAIWPAALIGGAGWELAKSGFAWYLNNFANYSPIYGSLGTVIVLLTWAYLSTLLVLLSAEICAAVNDWIIEREQDDAPPPLDT